MKRLLRVDEDGAYGPSGYVRWNDLRPEARLMLGAVMDLTAEVGRVADLLEAAGPPPRPITVEELEDMPLEEAREKLGLLPLQGTP